MKIKIISCFLCLVIIQCSKIKDIDSTDFYSIKNISSNIVEKQLNFGKIDSVFCEKRLETSFKGEYTMYNDKIYFFDAAFGYLFEFDTDLNYLNRYWGIGNGPDEIFNGSLLAINFTKFITFGSRGYINIFDAKMKKIKQFHIDWYQNRPPKEILKNPKADFFDTYEMDFTQSCRVKLLNNNHIIIPISASHPKFNGYFDTDLYYNYSRILASVNLDTGKIDTIFGRRSPEYLKKKNLPNFDHFDFDVDENFIYINFWIDKNIYVLDKKNFNLIDVFGVEGENMKLNYETTDKYEGTDRLKSIHLAKYGYYHSVKSISDEKLFFRIYSIGQNSNTNRLQVYKNKILVSDIEIQKDMTVLGYSNETIFLSKTKDATADRIVIYKIKLENEI